MIARAAGTTAARRYNRLRHPVTGLPIHLETWFFAVSAFLFGLILGSFLNVCIHRLPRGESVVSPRSACPHCGALIAAYDNIPVLSWFLLGGKCRRCRAPIARRYWVVELLMGLLFLACVLRFGVGAPAVKYAVFCFLVVGLIFTDYDTRLLPDTLTLPGLGIGLAFSLLVQADGFSGLWLQQSLRLAPALVAMRVMSFADSLLGALVGALAVWGIGAAYKQMRGVEGMGFGDVKLMAMVGAFLGVKLALLTLMLGSLSGSVAGACAYLQVRRKRARRWRAAGRDAAEAARRARAQAALIWRHYEMPFGVFLGAGALATAFFGAPLLHWYFGFFS
jgi:leader peptidase (prepilin peptidase)/N-methyltransferase